MAFGVKNPNQQVFQAAARTENPTQHDVFYFCDFHQHLAPNSSGLYAEGGIVAGRQSGGTISSNPSTGIAAFGITACSGVIELGTSAASNNTASSGVGFYNGVQYRVVPGIQTPTSGIISKYEYETLIRTGSVIFNNAASLGGWIRCGYANNSVGTTQPGSGIYFEFRQNATTNDTTFWIVWRESSSEERFNTGVTVSTSTTYRLYLSIERNTAGVVTTTYKIKNMTTGTNTEGTASPANTARIPTGTTPMGAGVSIARENSITATIIILLIDYIGVRIRRPLNREIGLGG